MDSGIYKIEINNKIYIGSAINIVMRKNRHLHDLRNNKHSNNRLQNSFNKYGEKKMLFEIIEYVDKTNLIVREQYYIDKINPFFNICKTAGNTLGRKHKLQSKKLVSDANKGNKYCLNRKVSEITKNKISQKAKERGISNNFIIASKKANVGRKDTLERIEKRISKQLKLNNIQINEIREKLKKGIKQIIIANEYNVSQRVISKIKNNIGFYGNH